MSECFNAHRLRQPACKRVARLDEGGDVMDVWVSIREMCGVLGYDRRAVIRVLKGCRGFRSVKGFSFKLVGNGCE